MDNICGNTTCRMNDGSFTCNIGREHCILENPPHSGKSGLVAGSVPKRKTGVWTLISPDGKEYKADNPLR